MLRTLPQTRDHRLLVRLVGIAIFTLLMIASAKVKIEIGLPVPFTMQVFAVLLAGMVLGARDGAASVIAYVGLLAMGLPFDARGLGAAALFGPTGGFLLGFIAAAFIAGYLVERAGSRFWQRWLAGVVAIIALYVFGVAFLSLYMPGMDLQAAWTAGGAPFFAADLAKALIAAGLMETGRTLLMR